MYEDVSKALWSWDEEYKKPTPENPVRQLAKAGALIAAEIDRLVLADREAKEKKRKKRAESGGAK
jgi:hypothetical protein